MSDWDDKIRKMFSTTFRLPYKQGAEEQAINNVRGEDLLLILEAARILREKGDILEQIKTIPIKSGEYNTTLARALAEGRYPEILSSFQRPSEDTLLPNVFAAATPVAIPDIEPDKLPAAQARTPFGLNKIYQRV